MSSIPKKIGSFIHEKSNSLAGFNIKCHLYRHEKLSTPFFYIETDDINNFFSLHFRTPQIDNTGVSHMLEHLSMRGSNKYPIRKVLFELKKRSYANYMNAFTSNEFTAFPFASINEADFMNCLDVYLDCAFHPKLTEVDFLSECYHIMFEDNDPSKPLHHAGVIFNEMIGAYSNPLKIFRHALDEVLFPNTPARFDTGGVPSDIPKATWENIKRHHRVYYHPVNAFFFFYGSFSQIKVFEKVDQVISQFNIIPSPYNARLYEMKPWDQMKTIDIKVPANQQIPIEEQYSLTISWVSTIPITDNHFISAMEILLSLLSSSNNSPIYKALIETGLCKSATATIFPNHLYPSFKITATGFKKENTQKIENSIWYVLRKSREEGFDMERFEACIHQLKITQRIIPESFGLSLFFSVAEQWLHGADPTELVDFNAKLDYLYQNCKKEGFFQDMIQKHFLDNKHCVSARLIPIAGMHDEMLEQERIKLEEMKKLLTQEQIQQIIENKKRIEEEQNKPQPLNLLPKIHRDDLSKKSTIKPPTYKNEKEKIYTFINPTFGVSYITIILDVPTDIPYLNLMNFLCSVMVKVGAGKYNEYELSLYIERWFYTASICGSVAPYYENEIAKNHAMISISGICLDEDLDKLLDVLKSLVTQVHWNNYSKIEILKQQLLTDNAKSIIPGSFSYNKGVANAQISDDEAFREMTTGLFSTLDTIKFLSNPEATPEQLSQILELLYLQIFSNSTIRSYVSCIEETREKAENVARELVHDIHTISKTNYTPINYSSLLKEKLHKDHIFIDLKMPTTHTTMSTYCVPSNDFINSACFILLKEVFTHYIMLPILREQLGAYGGYGSYSKANGIFSLSSYRETTPLKTLAAMKDSIKKACEIIDDESCDNACVMYLSICDQPQQIGNAGFAHAIIGDTPELSQKFRDIILSLTTDDLKEAAKSLIGKKYYVSIIGSKMVANIPEDFEIISV